jgi:hypothetical protein
MLSNKRSFFHWLKTDLQFFRGGASDAPRRSETSKSCG